MSVAHDLKFTIEFDREDDGRYIAYVDALPGVMAYGATRKEALRNVAALVYSTISDRIRHGEIKYAPDKLELLHA